MLSVLNTVRDMSTENMLITQCFLCNQLLRGKNHCIKKIQVLPLIWVFLGRGSEPGDKNELLCDKGNFWSLFISLCFMFPAFKASQLEHMGSLTMAIRWNPSVSLCRDFGCVPCTLFIHWKCLQVVEKCFLKEKVTACWEAWQSWKF